LVPGSAGARSSNTGDVKLRFVNAACGRHRRPRN
jgi:oxalate decarboxylase/phosphoglucose isomerase-like protein (cupin superfamily)